LRFCFLLIWIHHLPSYFNEHLQCKSVDCSRSTRMFGLFRYVMCAFNYIICNSYHVGQWREEKCSRITPRTKCRKTIYPKWGLWDTMHFIQLFVSSFLFLCVDRFYHSLSIAGYSLFNTLPLEDKWSTLRSAMWVSTTVYLNSLINEGDDDSNHWSPIAIRIFCVETLIHKQLCLILLILRASCNQS
jgi:hypothetical protein